jgi:thiosulfate/3-mercaptopyruvate sulfurtransferase
MNHTQPSAEGRSLLWSPAETADALTAPEVKVLDVRRGEAFAQGHIPGALHWSLYGVNLYDTDDAPLAAFARTIAFLVGYAGIGRDDTVVVCGQFTDESAARALWLLEWLGHPRAHVLDGGFRAWEADGLPVTESAEMPRALDYPCQPRRDRVASWRDVLAAVEAPDGIVLDTRSDAEWRGTNLRGTPRGGTVPGAVHLEWTRCLDDRGRLLPADALEALFQSRGLGPDHQVVTLCNTGYRSAHACLALRTLGYPRLRNYVGSWQEWAYREDCPVVVPNDDEGPAPLAGA